MPGGLPRAARALLLPLRPLLALLLGCVLAGTPALCGAQSNPASPAGSVVAPAAASRPDAIPGGTTPQDAPALAAPAAPPGPPSGMALILPAKADGFARASEVTRKGFMAARDVSVDKPAVQVLETDGTAASAVAAYQQALAQNVAVIVGPLTKTEVAAVQNEAIRVPTLMLNAPDGALTAARGLYVLSLSTELEAKVAAETAYRTDAGAAVIVTTPAPLSKRAAAAFADAWTRLGGNVKATLEYSGNPVKIKRGVEQAKGDVVFLATDAERARVIRPFLGRNTMIISTSQVYSVPPRLDPAVSAGRVEPTKVNDLNGLRFIDMPWLHQPDHTAVMVYARANPPLSADLERLYALGIDAFRVAEQLARQRTSFDLDGVTGRLAVHEGLIDRAPIEAEYRDGTPVPLEGAVVAHGAADAGSAGTGR